ncbi:hypothetical protein LSTR_LSTR003693 [Laodelphax striatellus]|uniref:Uncharacterized protein n=1 Tax=Laodelphax striatellus TaxID=195883 RepID=A0A482XB09_LAOST|nr:hypothetical protein LSTR_LSTR003693 [Laodelphax striatellus]
MISDVKINRSFDASTLIDEEVHCHKYNHPSPNNPFAVQGHSSSCAIVRSIINYPETYSVIWSESRGRLISTGRPLSRDGRETDVKVRCGSNTALPTGAERSLPQLSYLAPDAGKSTHARTQVIVGQRAFVVRCTVLSLSHFPPAPRRPKERTGTARQKIEIENENAFFGSNGIEMKGGGLADGNCGELFCSPSLAFANITCQYG